MDPKEINSEFRMFFSDLYSSEVTLDIGKNKGFMGNLHLPSLSQEEADHLGSPITLN